MASSLNMLFDYFGGKNKSAIINTIIIDVKRGAICDWKNSRNQHLGYFEQIKYLI